MADENNDAQVSYIAIPSGRMCPGAARRVFADHIIPA
jgi:hypothetical protein